MQEDMKELEQMAEKKGYKLVKYDEYQHKINQVFKDRFLMVFQKEGEGE